VSKKRARCRDAVTAVPHDGTGRCAKGISDSQGKPTTVGKHNGHGEASLACYWSCRRLWWSAVRSRCAIPVSP